MRIALIADIHGNLAALEAVLAAVDRESPDRIVCLGDVAATGPQPRAVLALLRETGCALVMGNADAELLAPVAADAEGDMNAAGNDDRARIAAITLWCARQLDAAGRAFIASFLPTVDVELPKRQRLLCGHGSPRGFHDAILATTPDATIAAMMAGHDADVYAGGHTHLRLLRSWRGRDIVNPGSVGLAYRFLPDGTARVPPWADYAVLAATDHAVMDVEFRRVPYDRAATVRAMHERGMPHAAWWSADWG